MMTGNVLHDKSLLFAVRIVNFYKHLSNNKSEFVLSKQILRSGTSIGANIRESKNAESDSDYVHKLSIALKEADETQYWLEVLSLSNIITNSEFDSMNNDVKEIIALLTTIITKIKKSKQLT
jgi:four helix bundle protein